MPASNKYTNKPIVSPWTYVAIGAFILTIVLLLIFTAPRGQRAIYNSYRDAQMVHQLEIDQRKFDLDHVFSSISQRQLLNAVQRDELTIVFFGNPNDRNSFLAIQEINARFKGANLFTEVIPPSSLYASNILRTIRYFETDAAGMTTLTARMEDTLAEDSDAFNFHNVPVLAAFENGYMIYFVTSLTGETGIRNIRDFFQNVYDYVTTQPTDE